jgi:3-methyladenine DNA glycosylase/8-oxoguanine DNA glycosylase
VTTRTPRGGGSATPRIARRPSASTRSALEQRNGSRPAGRFDTRSRREGAVRTERPPAGDASVVEWPLRRPYPTDWVLKFLARRAIPGFEYVENGAFRRRVGDGWLDARIVGNTLRVSVPAHCDSVESLARVKRIFDADHDPKAVRAHLSMHDRLAPFVAALPGIRVPGAWDGFELAVRAILGQQVSVERMTRLTHVLIERYGDGDFPSPATLARENPAGIGLTGTRGGAIQELARRVAAGDLEISAAMDHAALRRELCAIPGIGSWTAEYIAMRAGRDPDAFPDSDWVVLKMLGTTAAQARKIAEPWRPWRAYALMYLWYASSVAKQRG